MAGARGRLLIIEDSPETSELLAVVVEEEGFSPVVRNSGQEGIDAFDSERPVAVLLDWVMPDRPGIDVCRQLRERDPAVPIIFVSGRDDEASISRGLDAGADDFVVKPVRRIELVARLEAHLRKVHDLTGGGARPGAAGPGDDVDARHRFGLIEIDSAARIVRV